MMDPVAASSPPRRWAGRVARFVALGASVVAMVGAFVPWGESWGFTGSDFLTVNATTSTGGALVRGVWLIVAPLVAIGLLLAAIAAHDRRMQLTLRVTATLALAADLWAAVVNVSRMTDEASVGPGLPLVIAAAAIAIIATGLTVAPRRPSPA